MNLIIGAAVDQGDYEPLVSSILYYLSASLGFLGMIFGFMVGAILVFCICSYVVFTFISNITAGESVKDIEDDCTEEDETMMNTAESSSMGSSSQHVTRRNKEKQIVFQEKSIAMDTDHPWYSSTQQKN